jgi:predicted ATPase
MLTEVHIEHFKCFEALRLQLRPLTLLTGVNSGGKSSVIQALTLLSQTLAEREWGRRLLLQGPLVIGASTPEQRIQWTFKRPEDRRALSLELDQVAIDGRALPSDGFFRWLVPMYESESSVVRAIRSLSWISAERTGPRELLPLLEAEDHSTVGVRGELAVGVLRWRGEDTVDARRCVANTAPTLLHQVRARMHEFFPGSDLRVTPVDGASAVSLRLRSNVRSDFQRPQNVGFGLTQLLPILVAVLAANEGDVLLIENPEVHLHPQAQQRIGNLLAQVAASGVQIIVESHSDHVLNGIRLGVKHGAIPSSDVAVHFFSQGPTGFQPSSPQMNSDGRLDAWPSGFFDQFDIALSELL